MIKTAKHPCLSNQNPVKESELVSEKEPNNVIMNPIIPVNMMSSHLLKLQRG